MNLKHAHGIFDGVSQFIDHAADEIRVIGDRVVIRDLGPVPVNSAIERPQSAKDREQLRYGLVLAVGPGDAMSEHGLDGDGRVRRRLLTKPCQECETAQFFDARNYVFVPCPACQGTRRVPVVVPPQCQVGDRVIYDRRKEAEFHVNGERVSLVHAEQSVIAVVEE